jgi:hypothetical protein
VTKARGGAVIGVCRIERRETSELAPFELVVSVPADFHLASIGLVAFLAVALATPETRVVDAEGEQA